jgi:hypothetical protein
LPHAGKTTIRVSEDLKYLTGRIFGLTTIVCTFSSMMAFSIGLEEGLVLGALMVGGTIALGYVTSRGIYGRASRALVEEARTLAEALAARARESIAGATPKLDQPATRRRGG